MQHDAAASRLRLGDAVLDLAAGTLSRGGHLVAMRPKSFRLLCALARRPHRIVPKDELVAEVWPDVAVSDDSLTQAVHDIRRALGDQGQAILRTVARRGFLLSPADLPAADGTLVARPVPAPGTGPPRIAVLPLRDHTGEPALAPMIDALAEEVTGALSQFRSLVVVARHSAFAAAANRGIDGDAGPGAVAARLRADYLVDGAARIEDGGLVVSLALDDVAAGATLWGGRFEADGPGLRRLRREAALRIAGRLFATIEESALRRWARSASDDLDAFAHLARGKAAFRSYEPGANDRARAHFAAAVAADPGFGEAHAYLAHATIAVHGFARAPPAIKREARAMAARGVALAPEDSRCHSRLAYVHGILAEFAPAEGTARRAVDLNRSDADALFFLAWTLVLRGRHAEALDRLAEARDLNPLWPPYYDATEARALYFLGRDDACARLLQTPPRLAPGHHLLAAAAWARLGDAEAARRHLAQARAADPAGRADPLADWIGERPEDLARLREGVAMAAGAA